MRFALPDPVLDVPEGERAARTWGNDPLIQVQGVGAFVRVLLPIRLTDGYSLTPGTWLAIDPSEMRSVWERWNSPSYAALRLDGYLANAIRPWGRAILGAPATAQVKDPTQNPYITESSNTDLARVLETEWPHEEILGAYADLL